MSIIRITADKSFRTEKKLFRPHTKVWTRIVKEFDGGTEGIEKAINYFCTIETDTPYCQIEKIYDPKSEHPQIQEAWLSTLVSDLKHSAAADALREQEKDIQTRSTIEYLNTRVQKSLEYKMKSALEKAAIRVAQEIAIEFGKICPEK